MAAWQRQGAGRLVVSGSVDLFRDEYLDKESNARLMDFILHFLLKVRSSFTSHCLEQDGRSKDKTNNNMYMPDN